jgi:probable F420-dependent oxidoreductase
VYGPSHDPIASTPDAGARLCDDAPAMATTFSAGLPQLLDEDGPSVLPRFAVRAEELGFTGLWSLDSVPGAMTARSPALDGLQALTVAATVTAAPRLGIAVLVLPPRNAALLAREIASLDQISGGRVTVGVGVGRDDPGPRSLGLPGDRRVLRLRENLEVMRLLWTQDDVSYDGELVSFSGVTIEPKPVQRPGPPVWFGAGAPPALRRAARLGDGWMGAGSSGPDAFAEQVVLLREALEAEGRDPASFPIGKRVYMAVEDSAAEARRRLAPRLDGFYEAPGITERVALCGTAEECAQELRRLVDAGAQELLLNPLYDYMDQLEAFAAVAALVRA